MGIFMFLLGAVLGFISFVVFTYATGMPTQLFAGEVAICGAVLFAAGGIIDAVDRLRKATEPKKPEAPAS